MAARGTVLVEPIFTALVCGTRRGELVGLDRGSVDEKRRKLIVTRNIVCRGKRVVLKAPKSAAGRREIALDDLTFEFLMAHLEQQALRLQSYGV